MKHCRFTRRGKKSVGCLYYYLKCQDDLGLSISSFHNMGKSSLAFDSLSTEQYRNILANKNNG